MSAEPVGAIKPNAIRLRHPPPVVHKYKVGDVIGNWTCVAYTGANGVYVMRCPCGALRMMHGAGAMTRGVCMGCSLKKRRAKMILTQRPASAIVEQGKNRIRIPEIIKAVSLVFEISEQDLVGPSRKRKISTPRQAAIYLARDLTKLSLAVITKKFNRTCHTTAVHAIGSTQVKCASDPAFSAKVQMIRSTLVRAKELREAQ